MSLSSYHVYREIIHRSFYGDKIEKRIFQKKELVRKKFPVDSVHKERARTELYRKTGGWLDRGDFCCINIDDLEFILPILSSPSLAIDSSGVPDQTFVFCFFRDAKLGFNFLIQHLNIPQTPQPKRNNQKELKHNLLKPREKQIIIDNFKELLFYSCQFILVVKTNMFQSKLKSPLKSLRHLFKGMFSGYERTPDQVTLKSELKSKFYDFLENNPSRCDKDFQSIEPVVIIRELAETLSVSPNDVNFRPAQSHQSIELQLADIFAGTCRLIFDDDNLKTQLETNLLIKRIFFDDRRLKSIHYKKRGVKRPYIDIYRIDGRSVW